MVLDLAVSRRALYRCFLATSDRRMSTIRDLKSSVNGMKVRLMSSRFSFAIEYHFRNSGYMMMLAQLVQGVH